MAFTKEFLCIVIAACKVQSAVLAQSSPVSFSLSGSDAIGGNDFVSPLDFGGSMGIFFSKDGHDTGKKRPQPLNVIFSGKSSFGPYKSPFGSFKDSDHDIFLQENGFAQYLSALNFGDACHGVHEGTLAWANVSSAVEAGMEGKKSVTKLLDLLYRDNHKDRVNGTCEHVDGFHFRGWRQRDSGAWFLDASQTYTLKNGSTAFKENGWDLGRDEVAKRALKGGRDAKGCEWPPATVKNITGLIKPDAGGPASAWAHETGTDGIVKLITVGIPSCRHESSEKERKNHGKGALPAPGDEGDVSGAAPPKKKKTSPDHILHPDVLSN